MADTSLQTAIDAAHAEITAELDKAAPVEESKVENTEVAEEVSESEEVEETSSETPDLTEEQLLESKNLYKALNGPQANAIIAALAAQAGLLPKPGETSLTKSETAEARRDTLQIVKDALGPEYSFLSDKLGKIFDEIAKEQKAENDARFAEIQATQVEREVTTAYEKLAVETKGESKKFEARMAQLSEEVPIGSMNVKTYMQRLYAIASSERRSSPQKVADQIRKNANDIPNRLKSSNGPTPPAGGEMPEFKGPKALDQAIAWSAEQVKKGTRA